VTDVSWALLMQVKKLQTPKRKASMMVRVKKRTKTGQEMFFTSLWFT
jgi:hypothetical protein